MSSKIFSPMKAIRMKCLDCSVGSTTEVRLCPVKDCALYPYRFGKRPATAGKAGYDIRPQ
jgi:hypothetical protein